MSGGPPHHPHGRQIPQTNPAWNHLQVPNYYPSRQPQHAHMSTDHSFLHQSSWLNAAAAAAAAAEPMKPMTHSHLFGLEQMLSDRQFPRHTPGVDLTLARNGSQNGDLTSPPAPISLSVRDANKINSLPPSAMEVQAVELTKCPASPGTKPGPAHKSIIPGAASPALMSPILKPGSPANLKPASPSLKSINPGLGVLSGSLTSNVESLKNLKRSNKRVDSILERLNPTLDKTIVSLDKPPVFQEKTVESDKPVFVEQATKPEVPEVSQEKPSASVASGHVSVSTHDENSNSSSTANTVLSANPKEDDVLSPCSNEDSLDGNKSRRKRKPSKTVRVAKDDDKMIDSDTDLAKTLEDSVTDSGIREDKPDDTRGINHSVQDGVLVERRTLIEEEEENCGKRRKTSSESETLDNIAAMVQEVMEEKKSKLEETRKEEVKKEEASSELASVIKSVDNIQELLNESKEKINQNESTAPASPLVSLAQKKATNTHFVEVENKLEEMFAGIEDDDDPLKTDTIVIEDDSKIEDSLLKLEDSIILTGEDTPSVSNENTANKTFPKKIKKKTPSKSQTDTKKKKSVKKTPEKTLIKTVVTKLKTKKQLNGKPANSKVESVKDIYAYDSGSNASSNKSRGPFIHIRGPRESPLSVNVVNTPSLDDDFDKRPPKTKKFHDDSEYRHKVRSKGLHSSTLSNKYDSQTKDTSWICAFCKRGPHASYLNDPSERNINIAPGDLFGPYVITTNCPEYERRLNDPYDKQFKSKKISKVLDSAAIQLAKLANKKTKRKHSESWENPADQSDLYLGIVDTGNKSYEIWAHEECIVWSQGVHLVGSKIVGLEEAVWTCCNVSCEQCGLKGANVCCMRRGCMKTVHHCCALAADWALHGELFKAYCETHKRVP